MGRMLPTSPEPYEVPTLEEVDASAKEQVHQAAQFRALDEMLGLIGSERNFDEMYNAWWLPVVTSLYSGQESTWVIVAGERRKRDYRVQGVFFGPACADGFVGTLSFDGTRLRHDGSKHVFEVKFSTAFGAEFEPKTLTGFFHNYGSGNSYCEVQFSERDANAVIRRIREGTSLYDAIAQQAQEGFSPDYGPFNEGYEALNTFNVVKGWYRAHAKQGILERHWDKFWASGKTTVLEYTPITEELKVLNREIVSIRSRIAKECRLAELSA